MTQKKRVNPLYNDLIDPVEPLPQRRALKRVGQETLSVVSPTLADVLMGRPGEKYNVPPSASGDKKIASEPFANVDPRTIAGITELLMLAAPMPGAAVAGRLAKGASKLSPIEQVLKGLTPEQTSAVKPLVQAYRGKNIPSSIDLLHQGYSKTANVDKGYSLWQNKDPDFKSAAYVLLSPDDKVLIKASNPEDAIKSHFAPSNWPDVVKTLPKAHQETWGKNVKGDVITPEFVDTSPKAKVIPINKPIDDAFIEKALSKNPGASLDDIVNAGVKKTEPYYNPLFYNKDVTKKSPVAAPYVAKYPSTNSMSDALKPFDWASYSHGGVPVSENKFRDAKALELARQQGYNLKSPLYKGGYMQDYPDKIIDPSVKSYEKGLFLADKHKIASEYGTPLQYLARADNPMTIDWKTATGHNIYKESFMDPIINAAIKKNADLLQVKNIKDMGGLQDQYVVTKPSILRAPFAEFAPAKSGFPYPMAGVGGLTLADMLYSAEPSNASPAPMAPQRGNITINPVSRGAFQSTSSVPVASGDFNDRFGAIKSTAETLGINPRDLAAVISYETGGTMSPSKWGGRNNNHLGLIQFGSNERTKYGVHEKQSFDEQMGSVSNYLKDRGLKPGMGLPELYSIINAGSLKNGQPRWSASDGNGDIYSHVNKIAKDHYSVYDQLMGGR